MVVALVRLGCVYERLSLAFCAFTMPPNILVAVPNCLASLFMAGVGSLLRMLANEFKEVREIRLFVDWAVTGIGSSALRWGVGGLLRIRLLADCDGCLNPVVLRDGVPDGGRLMGDRCTGSGALAVSSGMLLVVWLLGRRMDRR